MLKADDGLPAKVAQQLLQRIIASEFPAGTVLPSEREIGETYRVSRPVAREAIKLLAARGIVAVQPRQGAVVELNLTNAALEALALAFQQAHVVQEDLLSVRQVLEPHIVALAATNATPVQRRRLMEIRETVDALLVACAANNPEQALPPFDHDAMLHMLLADMSQNPVFKILIELVVGILWRHGQHTRPAMTLAHFENAARQHRAIIDAVLDGDGARASEAMRVHLAYTRDHIMSAHGQLQQRIQLASTQAQG